MVQCEHLGERNFSTYVTRISCLLYYWVKGKDKLKLIIPDVNSKDGDSNICTYI